MELIHALATSLLSPMVLCFGLGILAAAVKSDLKMPEGMYQALTVYLLLAIGIRGGTKLSGTPLDGFWGPAGAAVALCVVTPFWCYWILKRIGKFDIPNAAAIAAHYGSVSAVTFSEALAFLDNLKIAHEGFMPSMLAIMEIPAIMIAIFIARRASDKGGDSGKILHELLTGKGPFLLIGGMIIGVASGKAGFQQIAPFFDAPFRGILALFLLEVGLVTGRRLQDLKEVGWFLIAFAVVMPLIHGLLGVLIGTWTGLSIGGATLMGTLAASASYIAAPAAMRVALPESSPTYYLTASLVVTFPFNVVFGIPLYYTLAGAIQ